MTPTTSTPVTLNLVAGKNHDAEDVSLNLTANRCISVEDTALQLGIGRTSVYSLIKSVQLGSLKLGGRRVVPVTAINLLINVMQGLPVAG